MMKRPLFFLVCLVWCSVMLFPVEAARRGSPREKVEAAMREYARLLKSGTPDEVAAMYVPDGQLLEPGMEALKGRRAIRDFLEPLAKLFVVEAAAMDSDDVEIHGSTAIQWGRYTQTAGEKGKPPMHLFGRYVAVWRRQSNGDWKIARLIVQPSPTELKP
jgi:uncharacterized protein (TIGR02246 family)